MALFGGGLDFSGPYSEACRGDRRKSEDDPRQPGGGKPPKKQGRPLGGKPGRPSPQRYRTFGVVEDEEEADDEV